MFEFKEKEGLSSLITDRLTRLGFESHIAQSIANDASDLWETESIPRPKAGRLSAIIPNRRWVIRNEDLALIDAAGKSLLALLNAGIIGWWAASASGGVAIGLTGVAVQLLLLAIRMRDKGVTLDSETFDILVTLRSSAAPLTTAAIAERLGDPAVWGIRKITPEDVETRLKPLLEKPVSDGSKRLFVVQEGHTWRVAGA